MIDKDFFNKEGHLAKVENKDIFEINAFSLKNIYNSNISDNVNEKEAKPYLSIYEKQKESLIKEFKRSNHSRRLILNFDNQVLLSEDPNCMICMQFMFRSEEMSAIVYARSSDINKLEDDLSTIKFILKDFCNEMKIYVGNISFFAGSFHQYI